MIVVVVEWVVGRGIARVGVAVIVVFVCKVSIFRR